MGEVSFGRGVGGRGRASVVVVGVVVGEFWGNFGGKMRFWG